MNQKALNIVYGIIIAILLIGGLYFLLHKNTSAPETVTQTPTQSDPNQPSAPSTSTTFENEYMKLILPAGWKAELASKALYDNSDVPTISPSPTAVNITKGNYILYINTEASQASGVTGGRFAEIAQGALSADAVVIENPSPQCGTAEVDSTSFGFTRADLFVSAADKKDYCAVPTNGQTVWYFSYFTKGQGYFNYYKEGETPALVATMAYNSKTINSFPIKESHELSQALSEMTDIFNSLDLKKH
jgi:hypothetical protein